MTPEHLQHYREQGYVRVPGLVPEDWMVSLRARLDDYAHGRRMTPPGVAVSTRRIHWTLFGRTISLPLPPGWFRTIRKVIGLEHDDIFRQFLFDPLILDQMAQIIGPDFKLQRLEAFYKVPRFGWRINVHQDAVYWPLGPLNTPDSICTAFCFLDDATAENGCLGFLPGRHREGPLPAEWVDADTTGERRILPQAYREQEKVLVPCRAGDVVFFHGMTPHFSGPNHSRHIRRAVSVACLSSRLQHTGYSRATHGYDAAAGPYPRLTLRGESFPGCI